MAIPSGFTGVPANKPMPSLLDRHGSTQSERVTKFHILAIYIKNLI
jgi:hypothetical protein